jgi:hypothetical protein
VEKTIFIPRERLNRAELHIEKRWWKKLFSPAAPLLVIHYGQEEKLYAEVDLNASEVFTALRNLLHAGENADG